jgi:hypothetical protein
MKYFLGILGLSLIIAGIVYLLSSTMIYSEIRSFFSELLSTGTGGAEETFDGAYPFSFILFLPLLAGLILVSFAWYYCDKFGIWSRIAGIAGLVILLFFHAKVIITGAQAGTCYPNVWTGAILTMIVFLSVILIEYRFKTKWMQLPGIIYFFLVIYFLHRVFLWWSSETIFISLAMIALLAPANNPP